MKTFGPVEENVRQQMENCLSVEDGSVGVLCADNHLGYSMPIGGVVAYSGLISPSAVGFDIGCGNMAVRTDAKLADLNVPALMNDIWSKISFGVGRKNADKPDHAVLDEIAECALDVQRNLAQMAAQQLGTVGSGNHYVDLFVDDADGHVWIGVHFGSRGFGHKTATWALEMVGSKDDSMMAPPVTIDVNSELGAAYIDGMARAGRYAYAGREWVVGKVLELMGARALETVHNHHNFAWLEKHEGRHLWVHRKGATPAFPGQQGFIGANMRDNAVIVEGVESDDSRVSLYSTVHGAGRTMSRTQAAGKVKFAKTWRCGNRDCSQPTLPLSALNRGPQNSLPACPSCGLKLHQFGESRVIKAGVIDWGNAQAEMQQLGIELRGAGADEAPGCYKQLSDVLAYHDGTIKINHTLRPVGVAMAGKGTYDPYGD